ncbi:uncharacterized protein E0L32_005394 [Thyridium curvatum]|uniref:RRM domain-containing protein n=1 Tax=Thyridium curvatum TaxID=1093900 RepID=A0A507BCX4_9PEZI|nr:uncharacterized protein E0L32_005394 [Thyridium curvatum]TPX14430.1 hypothetical protein E0L32_005394 [Thyridium curvatum]
MAADSSSPAASPEPTATTPASSSKKRKVSLPELEVDVSLPEPPSKRAKRLLKKGKPLPPSKNADSDDDAAAGKDRPDDDLDLPAHPADGAHRKQKKGGKKKKGSKDQDGDGGDDDDKTEKEEVHGVWIGNLPFTLTRPELFKWLVDASGGSIPEASITRVNLPTAKKASDPRRRPHNEHSDKLAPQNRGFAYVDFATYDACIAAIALSETELGSRRLLIKNSKSFEGRPAAPAAAAGGKEQGGGDAAETAAAAAAANTSRKIFVGNLGFATTEDDLWSHFEKCGEIDWVKVATFEDTGKCKGYGWVKFKEADGAAWAVKGFVRIKEEIETEEDFMDKKEGEAADEEEEEDDDEGEEDSKKATAAPVAPKKTKMRKWWVNMLRGRPLKIQFAEDDQTRYKKRFGKDAKKERPANSGGHPKRRQDAAEGQDQEQEAPREESKPKKEIQYQDDINVARLTGAAVAPQGKKTTFE